jgi:hypothetical protein
MSKNRLNSAFRPAQNATARAPASRLARALIVGLCALLAAFGMAEDAAAKMIVKGSGDLGDGGYYVILKGSVTGNEWYAEFNKNGDLEKFLEFAGPSGGDPNPATGSTRPGNLESQRQLAKQGAWVKGLIGEEKPNWQKTPAGLLLIGKGKTHVPIWNPPGVANDAGMGSGGAGGFDPNGGPIGEQIKNGGKKGGNDDDGDGDGGDPNHGGLDLWAAEYPADKSLVNPVPGPLKGFVLMSPMPSSSGARGHTGPRSPVGHTGPRAPVSHTGPRVSFGSARDALGPMSSGAFGRIGASPAAARPATALQLGR